jgi:hypothetical protein
MATFQSTEQLAEHQARCREANERLKRMAEKVHMEVGGCRSCASVQIPYARSHALVKDGYARLVRETERFVLVEKEG